MNNSFTEEQEKYIQPQPGSDDYQNASEAVPEAMRLHEAYRNKILEDLRAEIDKGWEGPASKRRVKDIVAAKS